jgi:hypothetical protein
VTVGLKELHHEEFRDLYSSPSIMRMIKSRRMRWAGHVARMGERMNAYRLLVGKPKGKRPLGRPRPRWVETWNGVVWIALVWLRIGGEVREGRIRSFGLIFYNFLHFFVCVVLVCFPTSSRKLMSTNRRLC